jgi:Domain of unknown function (DUF4440)
VGLDVRSGCRPVGRVVPRSSRVRPHGRTFSKEEELDVIQTGSIHYRDVDIKDVSVRFIGTTAIVLTTLQLGSVVAGNEVTNPFVVTEVYVQEADAWTLGSMSFTRLVTHQFVPAGHGAMPSLKSSSQAKQPRDWASMETRTSTTGCPRGWSTARPLRCKPLDLFAVMGALDRDGVGAPLDLDELVGGQLEIGRSGVLLKPVQLACARDRADPGLLSEQPCQGDLARSRPEPAGDGCDLVNQDLIDTADVHGPKDIWAERCRVRRLPRANECVLVHPRRLAVG